MDVIKNQTEAAVIPYVEEAFQKVFESYLNVWYVEFFEGLSMIINLVLRAVCFVGALTSLVSSTKLYFLKVAANSWIARIACFVLLCYLNIGNNQNALLVFEFLGYFCAFGIGSYAYKSALTLGMKIRKSESSNELYSIVVLAFVISLSWVVFLSRFSKQSEMQYQFLGVLIFLVLALLLVSLVKKANIIYILLICLWMTVTILIRYFYRRLVQNSKLQKAYLPIQTILFVVCAIEIDFWQKGQKSHSFFIWAQSWYLVFYALCNENFCIEVIFGALCLINYCMGKKHKLSSN